jgi:hypothetical protein
VIVVEELMLILLDHLGQPAGVVDVLMHDRDPHEPGGQGVTRLVVEDVDVLWGEELRVVPQPNWQENGLVPDDGHDGAPPARTSRTHRCVSLVPLAPEFVEVRLERMRTLANVGNAHAIRELPCHRRIR